MLGALLQLVLSIPVMNLDSLFVGGEQDELFQQLESVGLSVVGHTA